MKLDHSPFAHRDLQATRKLLPAGFDFGEGERTLAIQPAESLGHWLYSKASASPHHRLAGTGFSIAQRGDRSRRPEMEGYADFRNKRDRIGIRYSTMDRADLGERGVFRRAGRPIAGSPCFPNPFLRITEH